MYDEDQDGFLNKDDMLKFFARIGAKPIVEDPTKLAKAFKDGDEFDTGVIDVADFVQMMSGKLSVPDHVLAEFGDLSLSPAPANAGEDDEATFKDIFNTFDFDKDGFLGVDDLKKALLVLGANLSADEVATIFAAGDKDKDGKLNFTGTLF
jgi:Ca2+-binding EF-hand superfamily protein